jgi:Flp pilus assembly protein TadG
VRRIASRTKSEQGAAAVEFALIAPLLFMLIFGIIQFGLAWSQKEVYIQAAREGARYAAVGCESPAACSEAAIEDRVETAAVGYAITNGKASIQVEPNICSNDTSNDTVAVWWNQQFTINIPFIPPVSPTSRIEAVFRCEV